MKPNSYLLQQAAQRQALIEAAAMIQTQRVFDAMAIALNDPDTMGKGSAMGPKRIDKVQSKIVEIVNYYAPAFDTRNPESDVARANLDREQKRIFKDDFQPFSRRYPQMKDVDTTKGR
jgi:hypothetical protein